MRHHSPRAHTLAHCRAAQVLLRQGRRQRERRGLRRRYHRGRATRARRRRALRRPRHPAHRPLHALVAPVRSASCPRRSPTARPTALLCCPLSRSGARPHARTSLLPCIRFPPCACPCRRWFDGLIEANEKYYETHGEPLFSSHMLDLSEEPLEENVGTCVEYAEIVPRSCQDRAEIVF